MIMGTQFWWFYDAAAAAIILVALFIAARKPLSATISSLAAFVLGLVVALSASGSISESIYENTIKNSNSEKLEKTLEDESIVYKTKDYIESLGYNVVVKEEKLEEIFSEAGSSRTDVYSALYKYTNNINGRVVDTQEAFTVKMTEGFAEIISSIVSDNLSSYAAETAAEKVMSEPESIGEFLALSQQEYMTDAAEYIEENYTSSAYIDLIKLLSFIILLIVIAAAVKLFAHAVIGKEANSSRMSIGEHICGGFAGIFVGIVIVFAAAVIVRIYTILGSGEMLFFNEKVIDETLLFRYVYNLVIKL